MQQYASLASPLGDQLRFSHLHATEVLSQPFTYIVSALSPRADVDFNALLGQHATVSLTLAPEVSATPRHFDGIVSRVALVGRKQRSYEVQLTLRPWFWFLSHTQDCKVFQNKTVLEIVDEVLADHPTAAVVKRTTATYTPWVYCVQYRESDFHFLSRLMEQEGIHYHFEHADGKHTLVLGDGPTAHEMCPGCGALAVRHGDAVAASRGQECVFDLACEQSVQPGAAVLQDYDFTRPGVNLQRSSRDPAPHALGDMEVFDYPGLYDHEADGEQFAASQREASAASRHLTTGESDARALACGGLMKVRGSVREADNTEYLVLGTTLTVSQPAYEGGAADTAPTYRCSFTALPTAVPYRVPRRLHKPFVQGPQTAVVVGPEGEEIHTDQYGRVKVQFHWDRYGKKNEKSSCWVRVSSPWAGKSFGFVQVPRIGQEVVVDFLEGDPDQPLITGRVYNAEQMPPWELPANATQSGVLTRSSKGGAYSHANALRFEDKKGEEQLWLHAEKDQLTEVEHDEDKWVGNDRRKTIDGNETTQVKKNRTETVGIDETIRVGANRSEHVGANETIAIGANRSEAVAANETITIGANRSVTIGGSKTETVAIAKAESIGAAKALSVGLGYAVNVGAAMNTLVGGLSTEQVGSTKRIDVLGGDFTVNVASGSFVLTAAQRIELRVGKASLVMHEDGTVLIQGSQFDFSATGPVAINGKDVDVN